jgi:hypothetical protein
MLPRPKTRDGYPIHHICPAYAVLARWDHQEVSERVYGELYLAFRAPPNVKRATILFFPDEGLDRFTLMAKEDAACIEYKTRYGAIAEEQTFDNIRKGTQLIVDIRESYDLLA